MKTHVNRLAYSSISGTRGSIQVREGGTADFDLEKSSAHYSSWQLYRRACRKKSSIFSRMRKEYTAAPLAQGVLTGITNAPLRVAARNAEYQTNAPPASEDRRILQPETRLFPVHPARNLVGHPYRLVLWHVDRQRQVQLKRLRELSKSGLQVNTVVLLDIRETRGETYPAKDGFRSGADDEKRQRFGPGRAPRVQRVVHSLIVRDQPTPRRTKNVARVREIKFGQSK